jgi:hypothetical protein
MSLGGGSGVVSEPLSLVPAGRYLFVPPVPEGASQVSRAPIPIPRNVSRHYSLTRV